MLNFRNTNIVFISLFVLRVGLHLVYAVSLYFDLILLLGYLAILFYGCFYIGSNFFIPVICSANTEKKVIAISFDDGPDAVNTPLILQLLKEHDIKAAFFCIGNHVAENKAVLKQVYDEGHLVGNHTFSHDYWFDMFSAKKMLADIQMMDAETVGVIGEKPKLFRPPYGVTNPNLKKAIINAGYTPVGWSARSLDTVIKDEKKLLDRVTKRIKPGAVFLFHDTSATTLAILPAFLNYVKVNGYELIRLDKLLNLQAYE